MKKRMLSLAVVCGFIGLMMTGFAAANSAVDGDEPAIMASPSVIILTKVSVLTIHTNIVASAVVSGSVDLNGVAPTSTGVDSNGHLVAKFQIADLDLTPGQATLTMCGDFKDGGDFCASDVVTVK